MLQKKHVYGWTAALSANQSNQWACDRSAYHQYNGRKKTLLCLNLLSLIESKAQINCDGKIRCLKQVGHFANNLPDVMILLNCVYNNLTCTLVHNILRHFIWANI